jgi:hypothetical protein
MIQTAKKFEFYKPSGMVGAGVVSYEESLFYGRERNFLRITEGKETDIITAMFYIDLLYITW